MKTHNIQVNKKESIDLIIESNNFGDQLVTAYYNTQYDSKFVLFSEVNQEGSHESIQYLNRKAKKSIPEIILPVGKMNWTV